MPKTVTAAYAKANLPKLLKEASKGKSTMVVRYKKPIAMIVPAPTRKLKSRCDDLARERAESGSSIPTGPIP